MPTITEAAKQTPYMGSSLVDVEQVLATPTPDPTRTHYPVPHGTYLNEVRQTVENGGMVVRDEWHTLTNEGNRYFGLLRLEAKNTSGGGLFKGPDDADNDRGLLVGLRNSHDKSFQASLAVGNYVFVCSNMSFCGDVVIARKHTRHIYKDLRRLVATAVAKIGEVEARQKQRFAAYKQAELSNTEANDLVINALDVKAIPAAKIPHVLQEYREPKHPEFRPRTVYSMFNAFTEVYKTTGLETTRRRTQQLHGLFDMHLGLAG